MRSLRSRPLLLALLLVLFGGVAVAGNPTLRAIAQRPFAAQGTVVVPDRFVRAWDPVTVFFDSARGTPGPEDHPERWVTMAPEHPGAWTWLDGRTLQFRPAVPWPALARYGWTVDGHTTELTTLMAPPAQTSPSDGEEGLSPVETITLGFSEKLDPEALRHMVGIELRPLPGIDASAARWLSPSDLSIKAMEEPPADGQTWTPPLTMTPPPEPDTGSAPEEGEGSGDTGGGGRSGDTGRRPEAPPVALHRYVLTLATPIPLGTRAILHFRLSRDDSARDSVHEVAFSTAEPFRVQALGCGNRTLPVTPDGVVYGQEQAVTCGSGQRSVTVDFTARPAAIAAIDARNLLRFEPEVEGLELSLSGRRLTVTGRFAQETAYRVWVVPTPLRDVDGRALEMTGESGVVLWFPRQPDFLRFASTGGLVERFGPQMVPMVGRGERRADLRIYTLDPLDRTFWPFPQEGVVVDESGRPAGPGEEPGELTDPLGSPDAGLVSEQIRLLGSPGLSRIVDLPLGPDRDAATFGLDLSDPLAELVGKGHAGTFLVGLRPLDGTSQRTYVRVQVTDLVLTTVEEIDAVRFYVTSLQSGAPLAGALVTLEGAVSANRSTDWQTLAQGTTGIDGAFTWNAPGDVRKDARTRLRRIVVRRGEDTLVLDADQPPSRFADARWEDTGGDWMSWSWGNLQTRGPKPELLCTLFSERPVYRPEDAVHLKGWVRRREKGTLTPVGMPGKVIIEGPGDLSWTYAVTASPTGGFYAKFAEDDLPSGTYQAHFEGELGANCGRMSFQMEAYRLPTFEASLHTPDTAALDAPFDVKLTASYFAGGRVAGSPVRWRVTQFPATWAPKAREGFLYSSDGRWSGNTRFDTTPVYETDATTDDQGLATLSLDPSIEPTAQPRTYVIEATVTGEDEQTVTTTKRVDALPPFVLGLQVPRYLEKATKIDGAMLVAGPDGKLLSGQPVTVRLYHREWHSRLQASDFSDGKARYVTDVVDEKVTESVVQSGTEPSKLSLPVARAGVYVVELESRDKLGRAQVVKVDLYVGGSEPVSWQKPQAGVFDVVADRSTYDPGQTATLVLQSPFAKADALVIVEAPEGNRYQWVNVSGGTGTYKLPIEKTWTPRVPVHVVLMRGRTPGTEPVGASALDLGKPATLANTTWLTVNPVENMVTVKVENPPRATPGETIPVTVRLTTPKGQPASGEVALWLVDAAVLSLGREQRLDPLPDFITRVQSFLSLRDTRNLAFGRIPFAEMPGGDGDGEEENPLDKATVRKNFQSVPYYEPALVVGPSGVLTVKVKLPDDLTVFKIRAKAAAGPDRFGVGTSEIAVRLPVLVQPALPRFVRPGDSFEAAGVARVVEGAGGDGTVGASVEGLKLGAGATKKVTLDPNKAAVVSFPVTVETPGWKEDGTLVRENVKVRLGVSRASDGAKDAFEVELPIRPDRDFVVRREILDLAPATTYKVAAIPEAARAGTIRRTWIASPDAGLLKMAGALDYFEAYPYGTTEARLSRARSWMALGTLRSQLGLDGADRRMDRAVSDTLAWLPGVVDGRGRVAQWPGGMGSVTLTAWAVDFLVEAKAAGQPVDAALLRTLADTLGQALRSDYGDFVDGEAYVERAAALEALTAAGRFDAAYFAELARIARFADADGVADVVLAGSAGGQGQAPAMKTLATLLGDGVATRLYQGKEVYAGLPGVRTARSGLVFPSETRTIARISRALATSAPSHPKLPLLRDALVTLGKGDGWGSTTANAEALAALAAWLQAPRDTTWRLDIAEGGKGSTVTPTGGTGVLRTSTAGLAEVKSSAAVGLRVDTRYLPTADGGTVAPVTNGFVVTRTIEVLTDGASEKYPLDKGGTKLDIPKGAVLEDHVQVVVPEDRTYVAIAIPLAAGVEALNPRLATAPPESRPRIATTRAPAWADWRDDEVVYYYDVLPKGTYDLAFRARATVAGDFVLPPATAERLYDLSVVGGSAGARVVVK